MANEFTHSSVGTGMTQVEFEAVGVHVCNSQATGDLIYASSATQLSRLAIGSGVLVVSGGIPAWSSTLPAITLGGNVSCGGYNLNNIGKINIGSASTSTIVTGAITISKSIHYVDTEGAAATDDLDNIYGGTDGDIIFLRALTDTRTVVLKHNTGNLRLNGSVDFSLDDARDYVILYYDENIWTEIARKVA